MNKQEYEQALEVIKNAPEGATHVEIDYRGNEWWKYDEDKEELLWNTFDSILQDNVWQFQNVDSASLADFHSLSDLRTILAQQEEIERLKARIAELEKANEWISVDDRLPDAELGEWSLPVIALCDCELIYKLSYFNGEHDGCWQRTKSFAENSSNKVTHWKPLTPPKGQNNE